MSFSDLTEQFEREQVTRSADSWTRRRFYTCSAAGATANLPAIGQVLSGGSVLGYRCTFATILPDKASGMVQVVVDWTAGRSYSG